MWRPKGFFAGALIGLAAVVLACGEGGQPAAGCQGGPVNIVVTLPVFADLACQVGGDRVTVTALIPLGADPHTFQPAPADAEAVRSASLILYNGLDLDQPALDFILQHARGSAQIIGYALSLPSPTAEQPPPDQPPISAEAAGDNPHMWLDVELAKIYVSSTLDSLEIVDAASIPTYRENAARYTSELDALQQEVQQTLQSIPQERRQLVTFHDSFPHFARRYRLELLRPIVPDPQQEPTAEELDDLAQKIRDTGVPYVFAERGFDTTIVERLAQQAGVSICTLYSDVLDESVSAYIEMMRFNIQELARCLGGESGA